MKDKIKEMIKLGDSFIGVPYVYGSNDVGKSFDCSSFVQYLYKSIGVSITRCTITQVEEGVHVELEDIEEGDLIFLKGNQGRYNEKHPDGIGHVVMYVGNGKVIHASGRLKQIAKEDIEPVLERGEFRCVRRII